MLAGKEEEMFRKVLVATDLVTMCDAAVITAAKIAQQNRAKLYILHVLEPTPASNRRLIKNGKTGKEISDSDAYTESVKNQIQRIYQKALARCDEFEIKITTGVPWVEIIKWIKEVNARIVVLGPHSQRAQDKGGGRSAGRFGSTLEAVLTREKCPTMIVSHPISKEMLKFKTIMVSIDFSRSCECALDFASKLAEKFSSKLIAFHMLPVPPYPKYSRRDYVADVTDVQQRLEVFCRGIPDNIDCRMQIWGGALPYLEILKCAEKNHIDLIIMGSHTKEKTGKWYPGSVVELVSCRSFCPVVVVTDPEALLSWEEDLKFKATPGKEIDRLIRVFTKT